MRSVSTGCNKQACISGTFISLVPSTLLSLQGELAFLPPPLTVHPAMDDRRPLPCSLTRLPHTKVALQLLQGSTVWSCPVWLQTKHERDSDTTSDHQTGLHVILTSFTRGEEDGLRHSTFCVKLTFCHRALPVCIFSVQTFGHICLCVSVCVFLSNFRTSPAPLWSMYCPSQLVNITMFMHLVCIVYVYSSGGVRAMKIGHLTAIRCQQELPTASALQFWSPMAVKFLTT